MIFVGHGGIWSSATSTTSISSSPAINVAGVAFRAADGDLRAVGQRSRRVAAADDRRNAEFARDDRRVTRASAAIGDDRARALHHRLPVGIGDLGDEHIAVGCTRSISRRRLDEPHRALADLLADRASRRERLRVSPSADSGAAHCRLRATSPSPAAPAGCRCAPSLPSSAPLDVHRAPVMLLDRHGVARELLGLRVGQRKLHAAPHRARRRRVSTRRHCAASARTIRVALLPTLLRRIAGRPAARFGL